MADGDGAHLDAERYPCPCCGYRSFREGPGSYAICPVCFWEDDYDQLLWPTLDDDNNVDSLITSQTNHATFGACRPDLVQHVRPPGPDELREPGWRPATTDDDVDKAECDIHTVHLNPTLVYYWRRRRS